MDPNNITAATELNDVEAAVRALGGNTVVGKATSGREVEAAFAMFVQRRLGRYTSAVARSLTANASEFIALAARHALPAISVFREFVVDGRFDRGHVFRTRPLSP
jgi:hypothetical protein